MPGNLLAAILPLAVPLDRTRGPPWHSRSDQGTRIDCRGVALLPVADFHLVADGNVRAPPSAGRRRSCSADWLVGRHAMSLSALRCGGNAVSIVSTPAWLCRTTDRDNHNVQAGFSVPNRSVITKLRGSEVHAERLSGAARICRLEAAGINRQS